MAILQLFSHSGTFTEYNAEAKKSERSERRLWENQ